MLDRIDALFARNERVIWKIHVNDISFYKNRSMCGMCHLDCKEELCPLKEAHSKREHIDAHIKGKYNTSVTMTISGHYVA